ncbi:MAG: DedA family protein [Cyanobacteria bacterium J06641_5]
MALDFLSLETLQELAHAYGYWTVFIGIALENAGIPLPGETITLIGGFLAGSGELQYSWVLASAFGGAILGDNFGYWLGRTRGWPLLLRVGSWFNITEDRLIQARDEFAANAARAVFFGRFVTLLRIFAGPLAGIAKMPYPLFFACNCGGAFLWATAMVSLSFFLGRVVSLATLISWVARFGIVALVLLAVSIALPRWWKHRQQLASSKDLP